MFLHLTYSSLSSVSASSYPGPLLQYLHLIIFPHLPDPERQVTSDEAEVSHSPGHWAPPAAAIFSCYTDDRVRLASPELLLMGDEDPVFSLQPLSQLRLSSVISPDLSLYLGVSG